MDLQEEEQAAMSRFRLAEKAAYIATAKAAFAALRDAQGMRRADQFDAAVGIFATFKIWAFEWEIETGVEVTDEEFIDVWLDVVRFISEELAVDYLAERWVSARIVRLDGGRSVSWDPDDQIAIVHTRVLSIVMSNRRAPVGRAS